MASLGEELLNVVNKLQDLVFNTIGNDSLDLPQIVFLTFALAHYPPASTNFVTGRSRLTVLWKIFGFREHCWKRLFTSGQRHRDEAASHSTAHQRPKRAR